MEESKKSGQLLVSGLLSPWILDKVSGYVPIDDRNMLTEFHRFTSKKYRFVTSSEYSRHSILIDSDGRALSMGQNKRFECGQESPSKIYEIPTIIPKLNGINIIQAACGRHHSLFLSDKGQVYACGDNSKGQCGAGSTTKAPITSPKLIKYDGPNIIKIDCGADFSVILDVNGNIYAFGLPEYGQLGNNTDGQYFITSNRLSFHFESNPLMITNFTQEEQRSKVQVKDVSITDIACGKFHTIALDTMGRIFTWGFGGKGQLGHNGNKNEFCPRLVKYLTATKNVVSKIYASGTFSVVLTSDGAFFMFGEYNRKNIMYPQQNINLIGYKFNTVACANSIFAITTENSLIVWGPSSNGELGIGNDPRSSALPIENISLKDMKIVQMSLGKSYSMVLVDTECEVTKKKYLKFPELKVDRL